MGTFRYAAVAMTVLTDAVTVAPGRALAVVAGAAVAAGVGVAVARSLRARPPAEGQWRRAGTLTELNMYPLKSCRPYPSDSLLATESGLRRGELRDRVFVAVDRDGSFVSARTHPLLVHVEVKATPEDAAGADVRFEFHSPRVPEPLSLDLAKLTAAAAALRRIRVHGLAVSAVDCGDEAAAWLRKAVVNREIHGEATAVADLRLAFYPREATDREKVPVLTAGTQGIYSDMTSYHVLTTASLAALNAKLAQPVSWRNFRPNFVVDGPAAFEEDAWTWLRVGDAVFKVEMPCGRCLLTTVNPDTAVKDPDCEPLKTLRSIRAPNAEQKKKMGGTSPMLGLRLSIYRCARVSVGDAVYVA